MVSKAAATAASEAQRRRGGRSRGRRAAGGGTEKREPQSAPVDIHDEDMVAAPDVAAKRLRAGLANLFRQQGAVGSRRFQLAAPALAVGKHFEPEQIWGQVSILYAPVLRSLEESVARLNAAQTEVPAPPKQEGRKGKDSAKIARRGKDADDDAGLDGSESSALVSSDDEFDRMQGKLRRKAQKSSNNKKGKKNVDDWRYALGKPAGDDEDDMDFDEDMDAGGRGDADSNGDDGAAFDAADEDDDDVADDDADFEDGDDEEVGNDEEGGEEDEEDVDSDAAMRELYGDDAEGDDDEDGELFDGDLADYADEREAEEAEEAEEGEEDFDGVGDDEDDDGARGKKKKNAASPFGPQFAPENPLDFTDIDNDPTLTSFQKEEAKRLRQVRHLEEERVHNKHWTMQGEVAGNARPRDALIDETLDFEHALAPAPVVTEHFTAKLEDRIKKRIADDNFDDVVRKIMKTTAADLESSKRDEALDAQKSKLSLMDLYEKEYMEKKALAESAEGPATAEPLTEIERDELKAVQMWKRLAQHLDALSNFFFTPKPVNPEVEARVRATQSQAPAITLEAVGLAGLAKENVLAPQDVFRPKRGMHADAAATELEPHERKAIRRAAKASHKASEDRKEKQQKAHKQQRAAAGKGAPKAAAAKSS